MQILDFILTKYKYMLPREKIQILNKLETRPSRIRFFYLPIELVFSSQHFQRESAYNIIYINLLFHSHPHLYSSIHTFYSNLKSFANDILRFNSIPKHISFYT